MKIPNYKLSDTLDKRILWIISNDFKVRSNRCYEFVEFIMICYAYIISFSFKHGMQRKSKNEHVWQEFFTSAIKAMAFLLCLLSKWRHKTLAGNLSGKIIKVQSVLLIIKMQ